jgi:hypothetical protein
LGKANLRKFETPKEGFLFDRCNRVGKPNRLKFCDAVERFRADDRYRDAVDFARNDDARDAIFEFNERKAGFVRLPSKVGRRIRGRVRKLRSHCKRYVCEGREEERRKNGRETPSRRGPTSRILTNDRRESKRRGELWAEKTKKSTVGAWTVEAAKRTNGRKNVAQGERDGFFDRCKSPIGDG